MRHSTQAFKVVIIGNGGCGKTSIINQYVNKIFGNDIGVDFTRKEIKLDENKKVAVKFWDISGQERFGSMTDIYYKKADGAIITFDLTEGDTWESVEKWRNDLREKVKPRSDIPAILFANKQDLISKGVEPCVGSNEMDSYVSESDVLAWFPTSAKENIGIDEGVRYLVNKMISFKENGDVQPDTIVDLTPKTIHFRKETKDKDECDC